MKKYIYNLSKSSLEDEPIYFVTVTKEKSFHLREKLVARESDRDLEELAKILAKKHNLFLDGKRGDSIISEPRYMFGSIGTEGVNQENILQFYETFYELSQRGWREVVDSKNLD